MKKIVKRFIAYFIDMLVILVIAQSLSGLSFINKQLDKYTKYYGEYTETVQNYSKFRVELNKSFQDKEISDKEYKKLVKDYSGYAKYLDKYYDDSKITDKEYEKIIGEIDKDYETKYKDLYYKTEANSMVYFVVYLVAVFAYFVGFNKITNGITLGKKLMRLKIVNAKDKDRDVSIWSYVIRALFLYQPIYYLVKLISVNFLSMGDYYTVTSVVYDIYYYLECIILVVVVTRLDGRGLHDLVANTRVILMDREGNEVENKLLLSNRLVSNKKKKIVEEPKEK